MSTERYYYHFKNNILKASQSNLGGGALLFLGPFSWLSIKKNSPGVGNGNPRRSTQSCIYRPILPYLKLRGLDVFWNSDFLLILERNYAVIVYGIIEFPIIIFFSGEAAIINTFIFLQGPECIIALNKIKIMSNLISSLVRFYLQVSLC